MIVLLLWRSPKTTCWCVYFFLPWKIPSCLVGSAVPGDLTSISACLAICSREMFTSGAGTSMACRFLCAVWYLFSAASGLSPAVVCIRGWACHFGSSFTLLAILLLKAGGVKVSYGIVMSWPLPEPLRVWMYYVSSQWCSLFIPFVNFYTWDWRRRYRRFVQALWKMRACLKPSCSLIFCRFFFCNQTNS